MKFEIEWIKNGWIVKHNIRNNLWTDEVFFRTENQAIAYMVRLLNEYKKKNV